LIKLLKYNLVSVVKNSILKHKFIILTMKNATQMLANNYF